MLKIEAHRKTSIPAAQVLSSDDACGEQASPWFLLQTKPNGYLRAEVNLRRQGVHTFLPRHRMPSKTGPAKLCPLFPGYIFASFDPWAISFSTVNSTFGVSRLVTRGYNLETGLPVHLVRGLQSRCDRDGIILPPNELYPNDKVRILTGPFTNYIAVVEGLTTSERVRVFFELMRQTIRVEIPVIDVECAEAR